MHAALIWFALCCYGAGFLLTFPAFLKRRANLPRAAVWALALGLLLHAAVLGSLGRELHRLPVTDVRSAVSFLSFSVTLAFFLVYLRYRIPSLGVFMVPFAFVLTLSAALHPAQPAESAQFRSGWLLVHICSMILGYASLFLTSVSAAMYLIQEKELKSKTPRAFYYRLPSLEVCDNLYYRSLVSGLLLLTVGILTGFVWASRTWQGLWALDPKILASFVTWIIYLFLFSRRLSGGGRSRRSAYVAIFGFAAVMLTFFGISFLSAQHGFSPNPGDTP